MHFLIGKPSPPKLSDESLSVLACTTPTFRARARNSSWRGPPRILELRANVILLLREDLDLASGLSIRNVERVHEVSKSEGAILSEDGTSIVLVKDEEVKYSFCDRDAAIKFRDSLHRAMRAHARAPSYVVLGKVPNIECMNVRLMQHGGNRNKTTATIVLARSWEANASHSRLVTIKSYGIDNEHARQMAINERNTLKYLIETNKSKHGLKSYSGGGSGGQGFLPSAMHTFETRTSLVVAYNDRYSIPLCDLHTLMDKLPRKRLPTYIARTLFAELLLAVHELHMTGKGIAYGDLRPRNIWITRGGHIRLCEFSQARVVGTESEMGVNGGGNKGNKTRTPKYGKRIMIEREYEDISPPLHDKHHHPMFQPHYHEQLHDDEYLNTVSGDNMTMDAERRRYMPPERRTSREGDIWSLGITLLQMLTGYTNTQGRMLRDILEPAQRTLLARMLTRSSDTRASARELMAMRWLRSVDFQQVKSEADVGMPRDDVLRLARKVGICAWNAGESGFHVGIGIGNHHPHHHPHHHHSQSQQVAAAEDGFEDDDDDGMFDDNNDAESEYAESEWSRMTREFCRVDGAFDPDGDDFMMTAELSLQNARLRTGRKKRRGFRRKEQVEHGRVLGFGLNMSNDRDYY